MRISDIMTNCPYSVPVDMPVDEALEKMKLYKIRHLAVVNDSELSGVISRHDVEISLFLGGRDGGVPTAGEVCLREPLIVSGDTAVSSVACQMADSKTDCVIVADEEGRVAGIFTTTDACRYIHLMAENGMELEEESE